MRALWVAQFGLVELWRRRLPVLSVLVAVFIGLAMAAALRAVPQADPTAVLTRSMHWVIAIQVLPLMGELVGALAGAGALAPEVERGTVLLLATKLPRWQLLVGKALGAYAFVLASFVLWGLVLAGGWLAMGRNLVDVGPLLIAVMLSSLPGLLVTSVAIAFSARATMFGALVGTVMLFLARQFAWFVAATHLVDEGSPGYAVATAVRAALPMDRLGEVAGVVGQGLTLNGGQTLSLVAPLAWIALAAGVFHLRDLGG